MLWSVWAVDGRQFEERQRVADRVAEQALAQRRCEVRKVSIEELPGGFLVLAYPARDPDLELVPLAFEDHAKDLDRLRARGPVPGGKARRGPIALRSVLLALIVVVGAILQGRRMTA